jgi:peptidoglycan/xylan/chitin deacetylase (PgdA/CDA1 family)
MPAEPSVSRLRWAAKKSARAGVAALTAAPAALGAGGVRVLTYHRFEAGLRTPFSLSPEAFDGQMAALARSGAAVSLADVAAFVAGRTSLPRGAVLVTIDDGDPSVLEAAVPVLQRWRIPSVLFTIAGAPDAYRVMSDAQLREVAAAGVEIGSHSLTHRSMARLPRAEAAHEARASKLRLEDVLGAPVTAFAYPFGTRLDYSAETTEVLREAGYTLGFTSQHGAVRPGLDPLQLPRVKVEAGDPAWMFPLMRRGALDAWAVVDATAARLQASR